MLPLRSICVSRVQIKNKKGREKNQRKCREINRVIRVKERAIQKETEQHFNETNNT